MEEKFTMSPWEVLTHFWHQDPAAVGLMFYTIAMLIAFPILLVRGARDKR